MKNISLVPVLVFLFLASCAYAQVVSDEEYMNAYFVIYSDYLAGEGKFTKGELLDVVEYYLSTEDLSSKLNKVGGNSNRMIGSILADAGVGFDCGPCSEAALNVKCCIYRVGETPALYECVGTEVMGVTSYSWKQLWQCTYGCCGTRCCLEPETSTTSTKPGATTTTQTLATTTFPPVPSFPSTTKLSTSTTVPLTSTTTSTTATSTTKPPNPTTPPTTPTTTPPTPGGEVCKDCCTPGEFSCLVVCKSGTSSSVISVTGSPAITKCVYDGSTLKIWRGLSTQTNSCVGGKCLSGPGPSPTSTTVSSPTTTTSTPGPGQCQLVVCGNGQCEIRLAYSGGQMISEDETDPSDPCCCGADNGGDCPFVECQSVPSTTTSPATTAPPTTGTATTTSTTTASSSTTTLSSTTTSSASTTTTTMSTTSSSQPTTTTASSTTTTTMDLPADCVPLLINGDPKDKADLVYLGSGFNDNELNEFVEHVKKHVDALFSKEPFKSNKNKFNVYYVKKFDQYCEFLDDIEYIHQCYDDKIKPAYSICPKDYAGVLMKPQNPDSATGWGGPDYYTVTDNKYWVTPHEMGHHFGHLGDEYDYGKDGDYTASTGWDPANCDLNPSCSKWAGTPGTGCFNICGYRNYNRPVDETCMMRSGDEYCPVCYKQVLSVINKYK